MENLRDYLTKAGWKKDLYQTKKDINKTLETMTNFSKSLIDTAVFHLWEKHQYGEEIEWSDDGTPEERSIFLHNLQGYKPTVERLCYCNLPRDRADTILF